MAGAVKCSGENDAGGGRDRLIFAGCVSVSCYFSRVLKGDGSEWVLEERMDAGGTNKSPDTSQ